MQGIKHPDMNSIKKLGLTLKKIKSSGGLKLYHPWRVYLVSCVLLKGTRETFRQKKRQYCSITSVADQR